MTSKAAYSIRTLEQAYAFVLQVRICGIFSGANTGLVSLWDVTDLPDRKEGAERLGTKGFGDLALEERTAGHLSRPDILR